MTTSTSPGQNKSGVIYAILLILLCTSIAIIVVLLCALSELLTDLIDSPTMTADTLAEGLVDDGVMPAIEGDHLLLIESRKIVITTAVNAYLSRKIVSHLLLLNDVDEETPIDLYICSAGGWTDDAFAVIDIIQTIKAPVVTHAIGEVQSAGCMIFASGTGGRLVYPNTKLGFHALNGAEDSIEESRYVSFWEHTAELPSEWLQRTDDEMLLFTPDEALDYNVADRLVSGKDLRQKEKVAALGK